MKEENKQEVQEQEPFPPGIPHLGCFNSIYECEYDSDLDMVMMEVMFCNGDTYKINIKGHHIKELSLFLSKEHANEKYIQHLMKKTN